MVVIIRIMCYNIYYIMYITRATPERYDCLIAFFKQSNNQTIILFDSRISLGFSDLSHLQLLLLSSRFGCMNLFPLHENQKWLYLPNSEFSLNQKGVSA
jgi:hypothetical protein